MATCTNKSGTDNDDALIYDSKASSTVIYHAGKGNDSIIVTGGKVTVYTDAGNNNLLVTGGAGHALQVGATAAEGDKINGKDTLTITKADQVDAILGSGSDEIVIQKSNGKKSTGALSQIRGGLWGDSFTTNEGTENYQLYGEAGNDVFYVNGGNNLVLWGGAANDTFHVSGGTGIKLRGGDSADVYNINYTASAVDMQLGYGNDVVTVVAGDKHTIKANLGINEIKLLGGNNHVITADIDQAASKKQGYTDEQIKKGEGIGYGVDKVFVNGAQTVTMNLGDGKDQVELHNTVDTKVYTEGWGDLVTVKAGTENCEIHTGLGDDELVMAGGQDNMYCLEEGNDTITVTGGYHNMIYAGEGNDKFYLQGSNGNAFHTGTGDNLIVVDGMRSVIGQSNVLWLEGGEDMLIVKEASYFQTICNDEAKKVKLEGGDNCPIVLGGGEDLVYIDGEVSASVTTGDGSDRVYVNSCSGSTSLHLDSYKVEADYVFVNWDQLNGTLILSNSFRGSSEVDVDKRDKLMLVGVKLEPENINCTYNSLTNILSLKGNHKEIMIYQTGPKYLGEIGIQNLGAYLGDTYTRIKMEDILSHKSGDFGLAACERTTDLKVDDAFKFSTVAGIPDLFVTGS